MPKQRVAFAADDTALGAASPPGLPLKLEVLHVGRTAVDLIWDAPTFTGTDPITCYEIWSRAGGEGEFTHASTTADADCSWSVPVPSATWLEFRVVAVNAAGSSPPSQTSMPVLTYQRRRPKRVTQQPIDSFPIGSCSNSRSAFRPTELARPNRRYRNISASLDNDGSSTNEDGDANQSSTAVMPSMIPGSFDVTKDAAAVGSGGMSQHGRLRARPGAIDAPIANKLGHPPTDEEVAWEDEMCEANSAWRQRLRELGFDPVARLEELKLEQARWLMEQTRRHGGRSVSRHEMLSSRRYVQLQQAIVTERTVAVDSARALERVTSFRASNALLDELEACNYQLLEATDAVLRREAASASNHAVQRTLALLSRFCSYDSSNTGALSLADFTVMLRAELPLEALPQTASGAHTTVGSVDLTRIARMHERADVDGDGVVDFNEMFAYLRPVRQRRLASMTGAPQQERTATPAADLLNRVVVHLAGCDDDVEAVLEDLDPLIAPMDKDRMVGHLHDHADGEEEPRWKRNARRHAMQRHRQKLQAHMAQQQEEGERRRYEHDVQDVMALSSDNDSYLHLLRSHVRTSVEAGLADHTAELTPRALRRLCRQVQRHDPKSSGRLDFDGFRQLCSDIIRSSGGSLVLSSLQLLALFSQADATGEKSLWCASLLCIRLRLAFAFFSCCAFLPQR